MRPSRFLRNTRYLPLPCSELMEDVHTQVEVDIAKFLGVEAAIIYAQAFSTISSVIPDFSKRGDIIVAYHPYWTNRLIEVTRG